MSWFILFHVFPPRVLQAVKVGPIIQIFLDNFPSPHEFHSSHCLVVKSNSYWKYLKVLLWELLQGDVTSLPILPQNTLNVVSTSSVLPSILIPGPLCPPPCEENLCSSQRLLTSPNPLWIWRHPTAEAG